jgi:hypothetical protein
VSTNPKLLDRVRDAIRARHYSPRTEKAYIHWIKRFTLFYNQRQPAEMNEAEIGRVSVQSGHGLTRQRLHAESGFECSVVPLP